jgi:hypothetical protein
MTLGTLSIPDAEVLQHNLSNYNGKPAFVEKENDRIMLFSDIQGIVNLLSSCAQDCRHARTAHPPPSFATAATRTG